MRFSSPSQTISYAQRRVSFSKMSHTPGAEKPRAPKEKKGSSPNRVGDFLGFSDFREHASEDFQAEVLVVAQAVGAALDRADFVV